MPTISRIRTVFTGVAGTPWYSNLYIDGDGEQSEAAVEAVGEFWDAVGTVIVSQVQWEVEGEVAQIDTVSGNITGITSVDSVESAGVAGFDPLPFATQALLRLRTGEYVGGREVRGRLNIPGLLEANNAGGRPDSNLRNLINDAADQYLLGGDGLNGALVVWSRKNGTAPFVSSASCWTEWAVLRSRRD